MRNLLPLALLMVLLAALQPLNSSAQEQPSFDWKSTVIKTSANNYEIQLSATLPITWWLYAPGSIAEGLDAPVIEFENAGVQSTAELRSISPATRMQDPLFKKQLPVMMGKVQLVQLISITGKIPQNLSITLHAYACNGKEFLPIDQVFELEMPGGIENTAMSLKLSSVVLNRPVNGCGDQLAAVKDSWWSIFLKGILGGLLALLMPCIFPMLPVTVSFFMHKSKSKPAGVRNGLLYAAFIFLIYVLASLPFHFLGTVSPQIFNLIATDYRVNLVFFGIFILFALSLFGVFNLRLPGSIANHAEKKSNATTIGGIFFMALTLAIVSFSCTGPILGFLLVNTATAGAAALSAGMAGFGVALAVPFGLFAMFPGWMKKLPKSGGWMETLKKSLAFVELALAFKFLSNADMVQHWGILKREIFIGIWALITISLALYLLGAFKKRIKIPEGLYNADLLAARNQQLSMPRLCTGFLLLFCGICLMNGVSPSPKISLSMVSGFPPPTSYSIYKSSTKSEKGLTPNAVNDYEKALALSQKTGKPILIDFTGWACVNCRKMEENVWTTAQVAQMIKEQFILVSLYVDDRQALEASEQFTYKDQQGNLRKIRTVGDKWAIFQEENFGSASQPQYVILSPDQTLLNHPVGFSSVSKYQDWLQCGINAFKHL